MIEYRKASTESQLKPQYMLLRLQFWLVLDIKIQKPSHCVLKCFKHRIPRFFFIFSVQDTGRQCTRSPFYKQIFFHDLELLTCLLQYYECSAIYCQNSACLHVSLLKFKCSVLDHHIIQTLQKLKHKGEQGDLHLQIMVKMCRSLVTSDPISPMLKTVLLVSLLIQS